jgi:hypothetical protein
MVEPEYYAEFSVEGRYGIESVSAIHYPGVIEDSPCMLNIKPAAPPHRILYSHTHRKLGQEPQIL